MFTRLKRFLSPPVFPDEARTRTAALLNVMLWAAIVVIVVYAASEVWHGPSAATLLFSAALLIVQVALLFSLRRGATRLASLVFCGSAFVALWFATAAFGGVRSSSYSALILPIILAGILLSGRAALFLAALSIIVGWLLMQLELRQQMPLDLRYLVQAESWLGESLVFVLAALALDLANRSLQRALAEAQASRTALQQRTLELEQERSALRNSEERYRNFIEQSMEGIWLLEFDRPIAIDRPPLEQVQLIHHTGYIAECNVAMARMYGYDSREEMLGKRLLDLHGGRVTEENIIAARQLVEAGYRSGNRETMEVTRQGQTIYFSNNAIGAISDGQLKAIWGMQRDITERKQIEQQLARRARQLQTTTEVSRVLTSLLDLNELLPRVVDLLKDGFALDFAGLFLIDETDQQVVLRAATGAAGQQMQRTGYRLALGDQSLIGWSIRQRQARLALDTDEDLQRLAGPQLPLARSELALPLVSWGRAIGALTLQSNRPGAFAPDDVTVLQTMADQVAIAITNARLFDDEKRNAAVMAALREIGLEFITQREAPALLKTIVTRAAQLLGAPMGDLLLLEPDGQTLREVANFQSPPGDQVFTLRIGEGVTGRIAQTGEPLVIDDYTVWPGRIRAIETAGYRAVIGVPIKWQDRILGVINLQDTRPGVFTLEHASRLQLFAVQAAVALENLRLFQATRQNLAELKLLHAVAMIAASAAEENALIRQALQLISESLAPDFFGVLLIDEAQSVLRLNVYHTDVGFVERPQLIPLGSGITGRVAVTGQSFRSDDVQRDPAYFQINPATRSELCVPLKVGDRILGVINMESRKLAAFSATDEQLLTTVAGQLASAIERLRAEAARRQKEDELAQERTLLRTLIDNLPDAHVFVKDTASRFVTTNAAHLRMMGMTQPAEVVGKTDFDFFVAAEAEQYYADEQRVIQSGQPLLNREEQATDRAGRRRWYLTHKVPLFDRQGGVIGLVGMSLDITLRKRMEERERAIARGLQAVVEAADELLQVDDLDVLYRRAVELPREKLNVERCGIFLYDPDKRLLHGCYGTDLQRHTSDEHQVRFPADDLLELSGGWPHRRVMPAAQQGYWEHGTFHASGEGWVALTAIGSQAEPIGMFSNDTAITHAPLDEVQQEALAVYCSLLGNLVIRKRAMQEREQLIRELEAKNAELERFTYTVSHDLKSPLITIRGFMGFLEQDAVDGNLDRLRSDVARITQATDRMQRLLNELLELSRIGRLVNKPEEVALAVIASEAVSLVEGRLKARDVRVDIDPELPVVKVDRVRLVEVLQNLLDNAAKFMGDQPAPLIEIGQRITAGQRVFFVRDNGQGIEAHYHDKIFGLFDKLDPRSEGTGIGLALVKRIIELHGGRIWVESSGAGQGATFCFTLPDRS